MLAKCLYPDEVCKASFVRNGVVHCMGDGSYRCPHARPKVSDMFVMYLGTPVRPIPVSTRPFRKCSHREEKGMKKVCPYPDEVCNASFVQHGIVYCIGDDWYQCPYARSTVSDVLFQEDCTEQEAQEGDTSAG